MTHADLGKRKKRHYDLAPKTLGVKSDHDKWCEIRRTRGGALPVRTSLQEMAMIDVLI